MLKSVTTFATRYPKRVIALWAVIAVALTALASFAGYKVTTDDTAQFLPKGSDSALATEFGQTAFGQEKGARTVTVLVKRTDGGALSSTDRGRVRSLATAMPRWQVDATRPAIEKHFGDVSERAGRIAAALVGPVAPDRRFQLIALQWKANATDPVAQEFFRQVRERAAGHVRGEGLRVGFTGGVASMADHLKATEDTRALSQALLFGSVILLSLLFLRGPLAAIVPLVAIYLVAGAAAGLVVLAALAFGFTLDVGTPQLITVVLVGIGVDYFLFLLFRLRERLRAGDDQRTAAAEAAAGVGPVIASAALAVVAAFATLALAEFGQFRVLGPAIAISVLVMLLAGVTLMPAIAAVTGRALFWPSRSWTRERTDGPAARLGRGIARSPGRTAFAITAILVLLSTFAVGTKMSYDQAGGGPSTPATRTEDKIAATLAKGASDPLQLYVKASTPRLSADRLEPLRERVSQLGAVGAVARPVLTPDRRGARIDIVLRHDPVSLAAMDAVRGPLREAARAAVPEGATTMIGGTTAVYADISDSVSRDMRLVLPVAAGLILLILMVTLRSAVAPLYLMAAVVAEFAATLGTAVLVFQQFGGESGVAFTLPLTLFLFVVALGTDYNILMTARLREEMLAGKSAREAVADAVRSVAPAIGAAGLVLASSFGTLILESNEATRQQGLALAVGILLASLVVSSILVPALTALAGRRLGWSGRTGSHRRASRRVGKTAAQPVA
jgi:putative drug exporter of the RND superfamily